MKKKILITDTAPLYPPLWGGPKRIWNLYGNFGSDLFDFTYVGISFNLKKDLKYSFNKIRDNFKEILCAPAWHYYAWHVFDKTIFRDSFLDLFVYLWMHTDKHFKYILNSQKADILICSHPWSSLCVNKNNGQFFIYDAHNCEYLLMDQILGRHPLKGLILKQVKRIERDACKKSDLILVCSEKEKNDLIELYKISEEKIIVVPNGANVGKKSSKDIKTGCRKNLSITENDKVIIFIGAYYKPNIDAVRFILEQIAPKLQEYKFFIVGTASEPFRAKHVPSNAILLGRVSEQELDNLLNASDMAINPMFDGSGINIKMLDYMAYGLPIVTTECGGRGIETFGRCPMAVSSCYKFIDNITLIARDKQLYEQMSYDGQWLVCEHYNWNLISKRLQDIILERLKYK